MSSAAPLPKANLATKKRQREGDCELCGQGSLLTPALHENLVATAKNSIHEPYSLPSECTVDDPEGIKGRGCSQCLFVAVTCPNCKESVQPASLEAHLASKTHMLKTFEKDKSAKRVAFTNTLLESASLELGLTYARKRQTMASPAPEQPSGTESSLEAGEELHTETMDEDEVVPGDEEDEEETENIDDEEDEEGDDGDDEAASHRAPAHRQASNGRRVANSSASPKKLTPYLEHALTLYKGCELGRFSQSTVVDILLPALNVTFGALDPHSKEKKFTYYRQLVATFPKDMVMESTAFNLGLVRAQGAPNLPRGVVAKDRTIRENLPEVIKQELGDRLPLKIRSFRWLDNVGGLAHVRLNRFSPSENPRNQARTMFRLGESKEDLCLMGIITYQLTRKSAETIVWITYQRMEERDGCLLPVADQEPITTRMTSDPHFIGYIAFNYSTVDPPLKDANPPGPFIPKFTIPREYIKSLV